MNKQGCLDGETAFVRRTGLSSDELQRLVKLPLFSGLSNDTRLAILSDTIARRFLSGTTLFMQGDRADYFYVMLDGWAKLVRETPDGKESVISIVGPGESFAEAAMFAQGVYPVDCILLEDSRLLVIHGPSLLERMREVPEIAFNMLASMSRRMRGLVGHIEQLTTMSTTERVANFLARLSDTSAGPAVVSIPQEKGLVAARLGMRPETLSRALSQMRQHGVICNGLDVVIEDVAKLTKIGKRKRAF